MSWGQSVCYCRQEGSEPVLHFSCCGLPRKQCCQSRPSRPVFLACLTSCVLSLWFIPSSSISQFPRRRPPSNMRVLVTKTVFRTDAVVMRILLIVWNGSELRGGLHPFRQEGPPYPFVLELFFFRMYPSILSFETINKLKLSFECGIPRPQDVGRLKLFLTW
jgi:hypothetical protein